MSLSTQYYQTTGSAPEYVEVDGVRVQDKDDKTFWHTLLAVNAKASTIQAALTTGFEDMNRTLRPSWTTQVNGDPNTVGCETIVTWQPSNRSPTIVSFELVDKGNTFVRYKQRSPPECLLMQRENQAPVHTYEWFPNPNGKGQLVHIIGDEGNEAGFKTCCFSPLFFIAPLLYGLKLLCMLDCCLGQDMKDTAAEKLRTIKAFLESYEPPTAVQRQSDAVTSDDIAIGMSDNPKNFCGKCGRAIADDNSFCEGCGHKLSS